MKCKSANQPHPSTAAQGQTALRPLLWLALAFIAITTHAQTGETPALTHTIALRGCTQEDAPALEIYLTPTPYSGTGDPQTPYVRFEISASPTEDLSATTLELMPLHRDPAKPGRIARAEFAASATTSIWLAGSITLDQATPGHPISGRYDITSPSGPHFIGTFHSDYPTRPSVCG